MYHKNIKKKEICMLLFIFLGSYLLYYYNVINRQDVYNSDFAYYAIAGKDIMEGNILLKGWYGSTNTYYFLAVIYGVFGRVFGYSINLTYLVSAFIWAVAVVSISYFTLCLNGGNKKKQYRSLIISLLCCYCACYLNQPQRLLVGIHIDAALLSFVYIWVITQEQEQIRDFNKKSFIIKLVLASACLVIAMLSDDLVIFFAVFSIIITFLIKLILGNSGQKRICFIFKIAVTIFNFIIAKGLMKFIPMIGGIQRPWSATSTDFIEADILFERISYGIEEFLYLFNADLFGEKINISIIFVLIHLAFILLLSISFIFCAKNILKKNTFNQTLITITIVVMGVIIFSNYAAELPVDSNSRIMYYFWIAIILLFSQIDFRIPNNIYKINIPHKILYILETVFILTVIVANANLIKMTEKSSEENKIQKIVTLLNDRNLTQGYGTFWIANVTTLASGCEINVNPICNPSDPSKYKWLSFDTRRWNYANFILNLELDGFSRNDIVDAIGEPIEEILIDDVAVMIWDKNIMPYIDESGASENIDYWWSILPGEAEKKIEVTSTHFSSVFEADENGYFTSTTEGQLTSGPYNELEQGKYTATFIYDYTGSCVDGDVIGYVDAFSLDGNLEYKKENMIAGENSVTLNDLVVYENCSKAELRSYANVSGITVQEIVLQKID